MPAKPRATHLADRNTARHRLELADAFREQRLSLELSQAQAAAAAGMSRNHYGALENAQLDRLNLADVHRVATVLGLDVSVRVYPGGRPVRDAGQARKLRGWLALVRPPLRFHVEVALPARSDRFERRAWDAVLSGHGARTAIELEMRMRDVQAMRRRVELKRRDDPTEHFILLAADTRTNRRVIAEFPELFADLSRLRPSLVRDALLAGRHPGDGLLLI